MDSSSEYIQIKFLQLIENEKNIFLLLVKIQTKTKYLV